MQKRIFPRQLHNTKDFKELFFFKQMAARKTQTKTLDVTEQNTLVFENISAKVNLKPTTGTEMKIETEGSEKQLSKLIIDKDDGRVVVKNEVEQSSGTMTMFGNSVFSSICVGGGTMINNGVTYRNEQPVEDPIRMIVFMPADWNLEMDVDGASSIISEVPLDSVNLDISGTTQFDLGKVKDVEIDCSGQSSGMIRDMDGDLSMDCSGQSNIRVNGTFKSVKIDCSGMGSIDTSGTCKGNFKVNVSGMCNVTVSFPHGSVITVINGNDQAFFSIASHALITGTTLPSGLKMPSAPEGYAWTVTSPSTASDDDLTEEELAIS